MTAPARPARRPSYFSSVPAKRLAIDLAVLGALFVLALLGFQHVYGGAQYLVTGIMALVLGTLIALIGARWRWGPLRITALVLGVYLLFGSMFAAPTRFCRYWLTPICQTRWLSSARIVPATIS